MAITCWALGCNHNNKKESCKFFRFPKNKTLLKKWLSLLRRDAVPGSGARVCDCHFREGKKTNLPELQRHNINKLFKPPSETKQKRGKRPAETQGIPSIYGPGSNGRNRKVNDILKERREMWIQALQRTDLTEQRIKFMRVCSKHFVSGKPAPTGDKNHPDYIPSINMGYECGSNDIGRNYQYKTRGHPRYDNTNDSTRSSDTPKGRIYQKGTDISSISPNVVTKKYLQSDKRTGNIPKGRNAYQRRINISNMCRVCLTQSPNAMHDLTKVIDDITDSSEEIPIIQALQLVTSTTIILHPKFPQYICPVCMSVLKMAYRFIVQFKESQTQLERKLNMESSVDNEMVVEINKESTDNNIKSSEVELIIDEKKYDLGDVVYVEEDEEGEPRFDGFLSKLGKEITATFAGEKREGPKLENDNAITILMKDKNNIIPVRELQIDEATNLISVEVELDEYETISDLEHKNGGDIQYFINETVKPPLVPLQELQIDDDTKNITVVRESSNDHTYSGTEPSDVNYSEDNKVIDSLIIQDILPKRRRPISTLDQETTCDVCGALFPTRRKMNWHKRQVHYPQERIFECKYCAAQFTKKSAYTSHTNRHLGKTFSCELCGRSYYTKHHLKTHMAIHLGRKTFLCNVCGKRFYHQSGLTYHMLLHTDEKRYQCSYCAKQFRMSCALIRHERTHTGEKPFQCQFCDRRFGSKSEAAAHENIHTGFRPYLCKFCRKGFIKTYNLKLHLLQHSGPHNCDICDRSFIQKPILLWHYKLSHKDLVPDVDLSGWKLSDYFVRGTEQM